MAVTDVETVDVAEVLATLLGGVDDLRVYPYVADSFRPPGVVIGLPDLDFNDADSGFCRATWAFPLTVVVSRNNDRDAQARLSRLVLEVATALDEGQTPPEVAIVEALDARPVVATVAGQELPAYLLNVRVRA